MDTEKREIRLKFPCCEDEYDRAVAAKATEALLPATALWNRRLSGPPETRPTAITYLRGLSFGDNKPRRCITVPVTGVDFTTPGAGGGFGTFRIKHAALDAATETKETLT